MYTKIIMHLSNGHAVAADAIIAPGLTPARFVSEWNKAQPGAVNKLVAVDFLKTTTNNLN